LDDENRSNISAIKISKHSTPQPGFCRFDSPSHDAWVLQVPEFADLRAEIDAAIEVMGGKVAPKFTWSSPHDATWVSGNHSLACSSADEVGPVPHVVPLRAIAVNL